MKIEATFSGNVRISNFSLAIILMQIMMKTVVDDGMDLFIIKHHRIEEPICYYHGEVQYKIPQPTFNNVTLFQCFVSNLFRVNNKNSLTSFWCLYNFEQISYIVLVFPLLILNKINANWVQVRHSFENNTSLKICAVRKHTKLF